MATEYPRARRISLGYNGVEDRMLLWLHLRDGSQRRVDLTRRLVASLIERLQTTLSETHPAAERTPSPDEVLQMEHIAAVAGGTGDDDSAASPAAGTGDDAGGEGGAAEGGSDQNADAARKVPVYLATDIPMEIVDGELLLGIQGARRSRAGAVRPGPVAGLRLGRRQAHRVMKLLRDMAANAEWGLDAPPGWMQPMKIDSRTGN